MLDRDLRTKPRGHCDISRVAPRRRRTRHHRHHGQGLPGLDGHRKPEPFRHYADDDGRYVVDADLAADHIWTAAVSIRPHVEGEHHHWRGAGPVVVGEKGAAQDWPDAKHVERAGGDERTAKTLWREVLLAHDERG